MSIGLYFIILIWLIINFLTDKKAPLNRLAITVKWDVKNIFWGLTFGPAILVVLPVYCFG
ncbi:MAG: hypothetical protein JWQ85_3926 [Mucilaginibacter sp.]|nr:hypothetical protein [Mucilaginibacter sp.]